uniref:S-protein homolog n=1 Tax=Kalanchoe fedtschenkoi TaxID=63787 RepID=A0A7N0TNI3_KALFE
MNTKGVTIGFYTAVLIAVAQLVASSGRAKCHGGIFPKYMVEIINGIGPEIEVHCKSKDDDLGVHHMAYGQGYYFGFRASIWGTTLFYCSARWNGRTEYFDAFDEKKDMIPSMDNGCLCSWLLKPDGPRFQKPKTTGHDDCRGWKPK